MSEAPRGHISRDIRYDDLPLIVCSGSTPTEEAFRRSAEAALRDQSRDPLAEADAYRDTPPEDTADELQLAKGEIAWLREAIRRLSA